MEQERKHVHFVYVTMDGGHNTALRKAAAQLAEEHDIHMQLSLYRSTDLRNEETWQKFANDLDHADFLFGCMIFGEDQVRPMQQILAGRTLPTCFITSNPALIRSTRLGKFVMSAPSKTAHSSTGRSANDNEQSEEPAGPIQRFMAWLRPKHGGGSGKQQTALVQNLTKVMKYIPGKARDIHSFVAMHDYWLHSTPENLKRMMCLILDRYVPGFHGRVPVQDAIKYPDAAIYHPDAPAPFADMASYRAWRKQQGLPFSTADNDTGAVGLLTMRAVVLSGNTGPMDALIRAIEAQGMEARAVYSAILDFRPAIKQFLTSSSNYLAGHAGHASVTMRNSPSSCADVDAILNCMGFPLVGGMAGSRPDQAAATLSELNVGYQDLIPLAFQSVEDWRTSPVGLMPIHTVMNIALPELDGGAEPVVLGGPTMTGEKHIGNGPEIALTAKRLARRIRLHRKTNQDKRIAIVLFNFPPNMGNAGTAMYLDVFASIYRLLVEMKEEGYQLELPVDAETLRKQVVEGNAMRYGTACNVGASLPVNDYRKLFPAYEEVEAHWGYAPGELLTDGHNFHILGAQYGNVFIGVQPSFGYEGDPMRLLMGTGHAPHHGFAAFYTWLDHIFDADAVLHFGTHGALEFMPGKQNGVSASDWPHRLLGALPNYYYYCVNNPSEGTIAKRRGAATLVSYMVPPLQQAGLYKGLRLLKDSLDSYRQQPDARLLEDIRTQAERLGIKVEQPATHNADGTDTIDDSTYIAGLTHELIQVEHRMIPLGLHILGQPPSGDALADILALVSAFKAIPHPSKKNTTLPALPVLVAQGLGWDYQQLQETIKNDSTAQERWEQIDAIVHQAMGQFVALSPAAQGAVVPGAKHPTPLDTTRLDHYLEQQARIPHGQLKQLWHYLDELVGRIVQEHEIENLLRGLDGGYIPPSPGNDVVRNDAVVPTGRNLHALDPYRVPTPSAFHAARLLVDQMLARLTAEQGALPESIAMVLWGTDNLKSNCEGVAQVLVLLGARTIQDELGNIADVELLPLAELGRPRIDVVMTVSGIFRDLLHHQMNLLDKAVHLAATAPEPSAQNFVRKHAEAQAAELGISINEAATRVFCNAPGVYGANINHLIESSTWSDDNELSDMFLARKSYSFDAKGEWHNARQIMESSLATVSATFQNVDSFEIGINDVDHYYEYLGGVSKSVEKLSGKRAPVLVADAMAISERLSSLEQMVRLESRAKLLNPKWYEAMLVHGYEGVREIETRVSNTYGWSATTEAVEGWVYDDIASTFILDEAMRERLSQANPHATASIARRLLEAESRGFWEADDATIEQLRAIYGDLEDRLEGIYA